jgi:excisionase family DNA binding protein
MERIENKVGIQTKWLNSKEAADYLRVTVNQLYNLTSNGTLIYYKLGRSNRFNIFDLDEYLFRNIRGPVDH